MKNILHIIVSVCLLASCSSGQEKKYKRLAISKDQYPDTWCLKVDKGVIYSPDGMQVLFAASNGQTYAVNGTAKGLSDYPDSELIQYEGYNCLVDFIDSVLSLP